MMKIRLLKSLDRVAGRLAARLLPLPATPPGQDGAVRQVLFIRPGGIGDAVHLIPSIQALQRQLPGVAVDVLAERRNAGTFALCPGLRGVFHYDRPGQLLPVLRGRYDAVIDSEQWHRLSAVIARLVRAPIKIGYATNERARLFTHAIAYRHDEYEVESFLHLLEPLGIPAGPGISAPWLHVPAAAARMATERLAGGDPQPVVVLFPGASIAERRWGAERFRSVAQWCVARGACVVVTGGKVDREDGDRIVAGLPALNLAGLTSLAETAAILQQAAVVISGDSGILHIAVGLGRPTVSLFGSGIAAKWAPRDSRHVVLNRHLPCSPCTRFGSTPPCPHEARCLREIAVDEVIAATAGLLDFNNKESA